MEERESWKQQYYRKPIVDHKLHLNKRCAAKVKAICRNPHMQTHTLAGSWQTTLTCCSRTRENDFCPVQDSTVEAGNSLKEAKAKYTDTDVNAHTKRQSMGLEGLIYIQWWIINYVPRREGRPWMDGLTPAMGYKSQPCMPEGSGAPSATVLGWSQHKQKERERQQLRGGRTEISFWGTVLCFLP